MRVLSWNLYHGRDFPPDPALLTLRSRLLRITERNATHAQLNRSLLDEFAGWLADAEWDVALLQEAPPRWFRDLRHRTDSVGAIGLTSRNSLAPLRRLLARLNPDLIASNEGGSNQILVRRPTTIEDVRTLELAKRPERRAMLWARVGQVCVANVHLSAGRPQAAARELEVAAARAAEWADGLPLVFGGDLNLRPRREREPFELVRDRHGLRQPTGPDAIDHVLASGLEVVEPPRRLPPEAREVPGPDGLRVRLSDHAPVVAAFGMR
jgi:endonuclease/exonuclease/phosphatase family metal-dependent hydrolase